MFAILSEQCEKADHEWMVRRRKIDTFYILQVLAQMVGQRKSSYSKALSILGVNIGLAPAKSSVSEARKKISWAIFRRILHKLVECFKHAYRGHFLWKGHNVYGIDGTKINLPRELRKAKYKGTNKTCFYPQATVTVLLQLKANIACHFEMRRRVGESRSAPHHLKHVEKGSVVVYDRLYLCKH